jgi:hypothetical protein
MKDSFPNREEPRLQPHVILVVMVFIGERDAYYIKLVSGVTAAIGLLSLRDTLSGPANDLQFCVNNSL